MKLASLNRSAAAWGALIAGAALLVGVGSVGCDKSDAETERLQQIAKNGGGAAGAETGQESPVERGKYLVTFGGCNDCHTPLKMGPNGPEPDMSRMLSGHPENVKVGAPPKPNAPWAFTAAGTMTAWSGPWGISYTMNLTPDSVTGIGTWTEDIFIKTLRSGKHWGTSRPIMPPMPWQGISKLSDGDLKAVYAYLRSIPPVHNQVPPYEPPAGAPMAAATPGDAAPDAPAGKPSSDAASAKGH